MSSHNGAMIVFLAVLSMTICPLAVCDEGEECAASEPVPLVYDAQSVKPVLLKFQRMAADVPAGYDLEKLLGSLPDRRGLTLGFLIYGDVNSRAVAVAVTGESPRRAFVDRDRDQTFAAAEEVTADTSQEWPVEMDAEYVMGVNQYNHEPRCVRIRRDGPTGELEAATCGCLRGQVLLDGRTVDVLRTDDTGNGLWFDPDDRFWVDTNGDGRFDPLREKFACRATCAIGSTQYAVAADDRGVRFQLQVLEGTGQLAASLTLVDRSASVTDFTATLVSESGIQAVLRDTTSEVTVPVGKYRMHALLFSLKNGQGQWTLRFAGDATTSSEPFVVGKDETARFDPIGSLALRATSSLSHADGQTTLLMTPFVTTTTGMYLTGSWAGASAARDHNGARTRSMVDTTIVDIGSSGFM